MVERTDPASGLVVVAVDKEGLEAAVVAAMVAALAAATAVLVG